MEEDEQVSGSILIDYGHREPLHSRPLLRPRSLTTAITSKSLHSSGEGTPRSGDGTQRSRHSSGEDDKSRPRTKTRFSPLIPIVVTPGDTRNDRNRNDQRDINVDDSRDFHRRNELPPTYTSPQPIQNIQRRDSAETRQGRVVSAPNNPYLDPRLNRDRRPSGGPSNEVQPPTPRSERNERSFKRQRAITQAVNYPQNNPKPSSHNNQPPGTHQPSQILVCPVYPLPHHNNHRSVRIYDTPPKNSNSPTNALRKRNQTVATPFRNKPLPVKPVQRPTLTSLAPVLPLPERGPIIIPFNIPKPTSPLLPMIDLGVLTGSSNPNSRVNSPVPPIARESPSPSVPATPAPSSAASTDQVVNLVEPQVMSTKNPRVQSIKLKAVIDKKLVRSLVNKFNSEKNEKKKSIESGSSPSRSISNEPVEMNKQRKPNANPSATVNTTLNSDAEKNKPSKPIANPNGNVSKSLNSDAEKNQPIAKPNATVNKSLNSDAEKNQPIAKPNATVNKSLNSDAEKYKQNKPIAKPKGSAKPPVENNKQKPGMKRKMDGAKLPNPKKSNINKDNPQEIELVDLSSDDDSIVILQEKKPSPKHSGSSGGSTPNTTPTTNPQANPLVAQIKEESQSTLKPKYNLTEKPGQTENPLLESTDEFSPLSDTTLVGSPAAISPGSISQSTERIPSSELKQMNTLYDAVNSPSIDSSPEGPELLGDDEEWNGPQIKISTNIFENDGDDDENEPIFLPPNGQVTSTPIARIPSLVLSNLDQTTPITSDTHSSSNSSSLPVPGSSASIISTTELAQPTTLTNNDIAKKSTNNEIHGNDHQNKQIALSPNGRVTLPSNVRIVPSLIGSSPIAQVHPSSSPSSLPVAPVQGSSPLFMSTTVIALPTILANSEIAKKSTNNEIRGNDKPNSLPPTGRATLLPSVPSLDPTPIASVTSPSGNPSPRQIALVLHSPASTPTPLMSIEITPPKTNNEITNKTNTPSEIPALLYGQSTPSPIVRSVVPSLRGQSPIISTAHFSKNPIPKFNLANNEIVKNSNTLLEIPISLSSNVSVSVTQLPIVYPHYGQSPITSIAHTSRNPSPLHVVPIPILPAPIMSTMELTPTKLTNNEAAKKSNTLSEIPISQSPNGTVTLSTIPLSVPSCFPSLICRLPIPQVASSNLSTLSSTSVSGSSAPLMSTTELSPTKMTNNEVVKNSSALSEIPISLSANSPVTSSPIGPSVPSLCPSLDPSPIAPVAHCSSNSNILSVAPVAGSSPPLVSTTELTPSTTSTNSEIGANSDTSEIESSVEPSGGPGARNSFADLELLKLKRSLTALPGILNTSKLNNLKTNPSDSAKISMFQELKTELFNVWNEVDSALIGLKVLQPLEARLESLKAITMENKAMFFIILCIVEQRIDGTSLVMEKLLLKIVRYRIARILAHFYAAYKVNGKFEMGMMNLNLVALNTVKKYPNLTLREREIALASNVVRNFEDEIDVLDVMKDVGEVKPEGFLTILSSIEMTFKVKRNVT